MFEKILKILGCNPLDQLAIQWKKEERKNILILWNRGLGDIPLWLYGLTFQIKSIINDCQITFLTREELKEPFMMLEGVKSLPSNTIKRGQDVDVSFELSKHNLNFSDFDLFLEKIEPKKWLKWQRGSIIPKLRAPSVLPNLFDKFNLPTEPLIAIHVSSETSNFYTKEKNWPLESFQTLFEKIIKEFSFKIILFGNEQKEDFKLDNVIDLRGKTTFFEMVSIIKHKCFALIAPDSGVLCSIYYLDLNFPIHVISLWGDPNVGVLKQKVRSPNKQLVHIPLIGKNKEVKNIEVDKIIAVIKKIKRGR